jgi:hypothetical protein
MQHEEIILIASGALRISANQTCWPAQAQAEEAVTTAIRGYDAPSTEVIPTIPSRSTDLFIASATASRSFARSRRSSPGRSRGRLAIQSSRPSWPYDALWSNTYDRELVGAMAWAGWDAQSECIHGEGRSQIQHSLECGF